MTTEPVSYGTVLDLIVDQVEHPLLVPNLGTNTAALMARYPSLVAFHLWGGMGLTHSIGLGVALAQPGRTVVVLDGDGSLLMGMGGLATIGVLRPGNLLHVVLDNAAWGNTGGQATHTADGVRLEEIAAACGYPVVMRAADLAALTRAVQQYTAEPRCTMLLVPVPVGTADAAPRAPEPVLTTREFRAECRRELGR